MEILKYKTLGATAVLINLTNITYVDSGKVHLVGGEVLALHPDSLAKLLDDIERYNNRVQ